MTRQSVLQLGSVLLDAMQRNPQATLADLREEVVKLEDDLTLEGSFQADAGGFRLAC